MTWSNLARGISTARRALAITILSGLALQQAWSTAPRDLPARLRHPDRVAQDVSLHELTRFEERFRPLMAHLPSHGEVGYVTSVPQERLLSDGDAVYHYYRTQYALAPLRVVNDSRRPLVIGNFGSLTPPPPPPGMELAAQGDGGLYLYRMSR